MTLLLLPSMAENFPELWTIEELAGQVALALAEGYPGAPNGRIRAVPDLRTIRYYTTLGLLDRPVMMRGRTALYGRKHLLQLVAIKRLQTQGLSLVEIQQQLLGKTEEQLAAIAQVPEQPTPQHRRVFWKRQALSARPGELPALSPVPGAGLAEPGQAPPDELLSESLRKNLASPDEKQFVAPNNVTPLVGVPLREGVTLLFASLRPLTPADWEGLKTAAMPLLKFLEKRLLISPEQKEKP